MKRLKKICLIGAFIIYSVSILALLYSVFFSGINYIIDNDEFIHSQDAYLIIKGLIPYKDYFSPHSALFHWMLIPIFNIKGFTFDAVITARLFMMILFGLRIASTWLLVKTLFGKIASFLFIPLFLLDPVTILAGMQIRPDNAALTFYSLGLSLFSLTLLKKSKIIIFISGLLISVSFILSIKMVPSVAVFFVIYSLYALKRRDIKTYLLLLTSLLLPVMLFSLYFLYTDSFKQMVQVLLFDSKTYLDSSHAPVPIGYLFTPWNQFIFGFIEKSFSWMYEWILPILGGAGLYKVLESGIKKEGKTHILKVILGISFIASWFLLFNTQSVHVQHYLTINWYSAILASVFISGILSLFSEKKLLYNFFLVLLFVTFLLSIQQGFKGNILRSKLNFLDQEKSFEARWIQIPKDSYVFPYLLFRPSAYPITVGHGYSDFPQSILNRFPPVEKELEIKKVPFLILNENDFKLYSVSAQKYIEAHYKRVENDNELWKRN